MIPVAAIKPPLDQKPDCWPVDPIVGCGEVRVALSAASRSRRTSRPMSSKTGLVAKLAAAMTAARTPRPIAVLDAGSPGTRNAASTPPTTIARSAITARLAAHRLTHRIMVGELGLTSQKPLALAVSPQTPHSGWWSFCPSALRHSGIGTNLRARQALQVRAESDREGS